MAKKERKLSLARQFRAMDTKQRKFLQSLDSDERKEFSPFLSMKYSANVDGIPDLQEYYLTAANQRVNRHFFSLGHHPELQWLLCTTVSPGMGTPNHYWLRAKETKSAQERRARRFLETMYPDANDQEIDLLMELNSHEQLREHARLLGWDERRIKDEL